MKKGMVTWRTNAAIHYIKKYKPICGAKKPYNVVWTTFWDVTCNKCKRIKKKVMKK